VLSVIVPAMHVDRELRRCLDSVRLAVPDAAACEIVLVVPPSRLAEAAAGFPDARVVPETRRGVYGAMNDGVQASRGEYLYFLGKDDILLPSARDVLQLLASERPYALFADVYWGSEGVRRCRASRWSILVRNVCQQGIVYSRESVLAHGPYLRRLRIQADHLLNVRVLWDPTARGRVRYLPTPLAWYSSTGLSQRVRDAVFYQVHAAIIGRQLGPVAACVWRGYKRLRPEKVGPA
jgi:glycosyltransferase involved in cell wall biosynthesis